MKRKLGIISDCMRGQDPVETLDKIKEIGFDSFFTGRIDVETVSKLRNKGYSKATIYKLISELKKENITEIYLWCESSLEEFYIKTGFHKVGNVYIETEL